MSAVISGNGLGLFDASLNRLGGDGVGSSQIGQGRNHQYVNIATGNLILQSQDEQVLFRGLSIAQVRTYNSLGTISQAGADGWLTGFERRVELIGGALNAAGSVIRRHAGDGSHQDFSYTGDGIYVATSGDGAHDSMAWDAVGETWKYIEGSSRREETYADHADATLQGRLIRIRDLKSDGTIPVSWDVLYDTNNRISEIRSDDGTAAGDALVFGYDAEGRLVTLSTREAGVLRGQVSYGYDSADRLSTVLVDLTPNDGTGDRDIWDTTATANNDGYLFRTLYTYSDATSLRVSRVTQSDGTIVSYTYDSGGRIGSVTRGDTNTNDADGAGQTVTFTYDTANRSTDVSDSTGRTWTYAYDTSGELIRIEAPAVDGLRDVTRYAYDVAGNVTQVKTERGGKILSQSDFQYDADGNLLWQWEVLNPGASASATAIQRTYTPHNQLASETRYVDLDPDGFGTGQAPSNGLTTHYTYDDQNRLRFVVDANGDVKEIEYYNSGNGIGQQEKARQYLDAVYAGETYTLSDLKGWATSARKASSTLFESSYDLNGRLSRTNAYASVDSVGDGVEDDASEITNYVYDVQGLLRQKVALRSSTAAANDGRDTAQATAYTYDGMGRLLSEVVTQQAGTGAVQTHGTTTWAYIDSASSLRTTVEGGVSGDGLTTNDLLRTEVRNAANELVATTESAVSGGGATRTTLNFYDTAGRLRAAQDASGGRSYFFYDAEGALSAQVDESGALVEFIRDELGHIVTTTNFATRLDTSGWLVDNTVMPSDVAAIRPGTTADDRTQQVVYDVAGRLLRQIDAEGAISSYSYDGAGRLLQILNTDAAGTAATSRLTRYFHDATGRQTGQLDAEGYFTEYRYDSAGRKVADIGYANVTAFAQRASGTLEQLRPPASGGDQITRYFHDGRGQLVAELNAEGYLTEFVFDEAHNQRAVRAYGKQLVGLTGAESLSVLRASAQSAGVRQTLRSFDALGRLATELNAEGTVTRYSYDAAGRLLSTEAAAGTSEVREGNRRYDVFGNLIGELGGVGSTRLLDGMTEAQLDAVYSQYGVRHSYDALGQRIESIDAEGNKTWHFYDAVGRVTQTVRGVADAQGVRNVEGEVTETRYTAFGDVQDTIAYSGRIAIGSPFGRDQVAAAVQVLQYVAAQDSRVEYTYGRRGQLTERVDAEGYRSTWRYTAFGDLGQQVQQIDASGEVVTDYTYDLRGLRRTQVDDADGFARSRSWNYDAFGRVVSAVDGRGNSINFDHDRLGRQVSRSLTVSGRTESFLSAYDAYGRTLTQTDALGGVTSYEYSDATRSVAVTTPEGVVLTTHRTRHGETRQVVDALGNSTEYLYDKDGQLVQTHAADGGASLRNYDARGLLASTVDAAGREIEYRYDAVGRLLQRIEDPAGLQLTTTYAYDGQGRQVSVTDAAGMRTLMAYDRKGQLSEVVRDTGGLALKTTYAWDGLGQQLRVTEGAGTAAASTVAYAYDALGRRVSETEDPGAGKLNLTTAYAYDGNDNVVSRTDAEGRVTRYTYDEAGRQVFVVDGAGGVVRSWYDANGRVVATRAYAQTVDLAGLSTATTTAAIQSLLTTSDARDVQEYRVHDGDGRLRLSVDGAGATTQFRYDAAGRQVGTVRYADPASLTPLLRGQLQSGVATVAGVLSSVTGNPARDQTDFVVLDPLGRVRFTVDSDGHLSEHRYDLTGRMTQTWVYATGLDFSAAERNALAAGTFSGASLASRVAPQASSARVRYVVFDAVGRERFSVVRDGVSSGVVSEQRFDAIGRVVAQLQYGVSVAFDPTQSETALTAALQSAIDDGDVRQTRFVYDRAGRQRFVIDATGAIKESRHDATGRVTQILIYGQRPSGGIVTEAGLESWAQGQPAVDVRDTRNAYDDAGRLTVRTDALGQTERYEYDGSGLVVAYTNRNGDTWNYEYDAAGRRDAEISPQVSVATVNATGTVATASRRVTTRIAYDALGNVTARTENAGTTEARTTQYAYDNRGNQIRTIFPDAWKINEVTGELVATGQIPSIEVTYDALGRAVVQQDVRGHYSYKVYDLQGRVAFEVDQEGQVTGYSYNAYGEQSGLRRYATGINTAGLTGWSAGQALTLAQLQTTGVLTTTASDRTLSTVYDQRGNKVRVLQAQVSYYTGAGTLGNGAPTTQFSYNAFGDLVSEAVLLEGTAGQSSARWAYTFRYHDALGRNTFTVDAEGYATTTSYNATGEVVQTTEHARAVSTEGLESGTAPGAPPMGDAVTGYDRVMHWEYDALGRKSVETSVRRYQHTDGSAGVRDVDTQFGYDGEGRVITLVTDVGTTTSTFDALGRATSVREPARSTLTSSAENSLLASASNTLATASLYAQVSPYVAMAYDAFGNLVHARRYANGIAAGASAPVADAARDQSEITRYDRQGRAVMTRSGEGDLVYSAYDAADNLTARWYHLRGSDSSRDALIRGSYEYDDVGRQLSSQQVRRPAEGADIVEASESVRYNAFGEIFEKRHAGLDGALIYGYDAAGRLRSSNESGGTRQYGYNLAGHQVRDSRTAYLTSAQSVEAVTWNTTDRLGRTVGMRLPSHDTTEAGTAVTQQLDRWGNVLEVVDGRGYQTSYQYNDFNQIVRDERPLVEVVSETGARSWVRPVNRWFYDAFGRLQGTQDANGNVRTNEYDAAGRLIKSRDAYGNATLHAYDALGNQRIAQNPLGYLTFKNYDRQNRIIAVGDYLPNASGTTRGKTLLQRYTLNQNGDRLSVTNALNYSALYDYDGRGLLLRSQTSMGVLADMDYDARGNKVHQGNALSGTAVVDRDGETVYRDDLTWDYDAYGRLVDHNNLSGRDYNYTYDVASGQQIAESALGGAAGAASKAITYYANGQIREVVEAGGSPRYRYEYDAAGNRTLEETVTRDGSGQLTHTITRTLYDSNNRVQRVIQDDLSTGSTKRVFDLTYSYDAVGNRRHVKALSGYGPDVAPVPNDNRAPVVVETPEDRVVRNGMTSEFGLLFSDIFRDAEQDALTLAIAQADGSALPAWLTATRNSETGEIRFVANPAAGAANQDITVRLTARETANPARSVSTSFVVRVRTNTAPTLLQPGIGSLHAKTNQLWQRELVAPDYFRDLDVGDVLSLSVDNPGNLPSWLQVDVSNPAVVRLSGIPTTTSTFTLNVRATDEKGASVVKSFQITTAPNRAPTGPSTLVAQEAVIGREFSWNPALAQVFTDPDGDALEVTASGLPAWMSFHYLAEQATPELKLIGQVPANVANGTVYTVTLKATDPDGATRNVTLRVTALANRAPQASDWMAPSLRVNDDYDVTIPIGTLFDDPEGDSIFVSAGANMPSWLNIEVDEDVGTIRFHGTPTSNGQAGSFVFQLQGHDAEGMSSVADVSIVVGTDYAPTRASGVGVADRVLDIGRSFSFTMPHNMFTDADGDGLTLRAQQVVQDRYFDDGQIMDWVDVVRYQALPSWLNFDAATRTFSGNVPANAPDDLVIRVRASDGRNVSASHGELVGDAHQSTDGDIHISFKPYDNPPPQYHGGLPDRAPNQGDSVSWALPVGTFTDPDSEALSYSVMVERPGHYAIVWNPAEAAYLPEWQPPQWQTVYGLNIDASTGRITGTPPIFGTPVHPVLGGESQPLPNYRVKVIATDTAGKSGEGIFDVRVNLRPEAFAETVEIGLNRSFSHALANFSDANPSDALTYSATVVGGGALPAWLHLSAAGVLSGTAPSASGTWQLQVTVTDPGGLTATSTVTVRAENDPPRYNQGTLPDTLSGRDTVALNFQVPAGAFSDPNGDTLTYSAQLAEWIPPYTDPEGITLPGRWEYHALPAWLSFNAATRTLSGTPSTTGNYQIAFFARDTSGVASAKQHVYLMIGEAPNYAPTAPTLADQSAGRNQQWSYQVPAFSDRNGDSLTYSASNLPAGISFNAATRTFSGKVTSLGSYTLTVTANDNRGGVVSASFGLNVINKAPIPPTIGNRTATAGTGWSYTVPAFSDPNGDALSYTVSGLPSWMSFNASTRLLSGTPRAVGSWSITVTAKDPSGAAATRSFTVTTPNVAPTLAQPIVNHSVGRNISWSYQVPAGTFADPNGDALTYSASNLPTGVSFNASTRTFSGEPTVLGSHTISVTASDGRGGTVTDSFVLTVTNTAPRYAGGLPDRAPNQGDSVSWALPSGSFTDPNGDALSYSVMVERPGHYAIVWNPAEAAYLPEWQPPQWQTVYGLNIDASSGRITGTPPIFGTPVHPVLGGESQPLPNYRIKIIATDTAGTSATGIFDVRVNLRPEAFAETVEIGLNRSFSHALVNFGDANPGDELTFSATLAAGGALPAWLHLSASGVLSGTAPNSSGSWQLHVTVTDPGGLTATSAVTVHAKNNPPRYNQGTLPDTLSGRATVAFDFQVPAGAFSDPNGDTLTYSAQLAEWIPPYTDREGITFPGRWEYHALPAWLSFNAATRTLSGTPSTTGNYQIAFFARDTSGAASAKQHVYLMIGEAPNYAPTAPTLANQSAGRNQQWSYQVPAFSDRNGDSLTYSASNLPAGISFNAGTRTFSGKITSLGSYTLTVTANDNRGGVTSASFRLNVINKAPTAPAIGNRTATAGSAWSYTVPAFSDPNGDALSYTVSGLPSWMSFNASSRVLSGVPKPVGSWSITVTAKDPSGAAATRSFTVSTPNAAPKVAQPIANRSVARSASWSYQVPAGTFADPNGDALSYSASSLPAGVSFNASTQTFSGRPTALGSHTIKVTASDGRGGTVTDSFVLTVTNTAPRYAGGLPDRVPQEGQAVSWPLPSGSFTDANGDALSYSILVERPGYMEWYWEPAEATYMTRWVPPEWQTVYGLNISASTGKITGTAPIFGTPVHPVLGGTSQVQPNYRVKIIATDPSGAAVGGIFDVEVNLKPIAPAIQNRTVKSSVAWSYTVPPFIDRNGDTVTYSASGLPSGVSFNKSTRVLSGTVATAGNYTIKITANDGRGGVVSKSFVLTVQANTKPTAPSIGNKTATVGSSWSTQLPVFTDPNGDPMTYTATHLPSGLSFNKSSRVISGTPTTAGSYTVRYTANDGRGGATTKTFVITVNAAPIPNRAPVIGKQPPSPAAHFFATTRYLVPHSSFTLPTNTFVDPDGNPMTYQIITKPSWLSYSYVAGSGHRFSGVNNDSRRHATHTITIRARDNKGLWKDVTFTVTSEFENHDPGGPGGPTDPLSVPLSFEMGAAQAPDTGTGEPVVQPLLVPAEAIEYWYTYDAENRIKIQNGAMVGGQIVVQAGYNADSYELMYDAGGRVVARYVKHPDGGDYIERTAYDLRGNKTLEFHRQALHSSEGGGVSRRFTHDATGQLTESRAYYNRGTSIQLYHPREAANFRLQVGGWLTGSEQYQYDRDGRLLSQVSKDRVDPDWVALWDGWIGGTGPNQRTDLGVLDQVSRVDYTKADGSSGFDDAGRAVTYRYTATAIGNATHTYTTTYQGWDTYQERQVTGRSSNINYKTTTNTLSYDVMGRLHSQHEQTPLSNGSIDDRIRYYAHNGDGAVQMRREGTLSDGEFVQEPGPYGSKANTLFVHAGGQQQAQLQEGGSIRMNNGGTAYAQQLQGVGGMGGYAAGGGKVTVQAGETLRSLAQRVYGTASRWYVLADANGLGDPEQPLTAGTQLNAPSVDINKNDAGTFQPYNPNEAIGNTSPSLPYIAPPPKESCNALAVVLMIVIAVVVTVYTAGAAAGAMGSAAAATGTGATATVAAGTTAAAATTGTFATGAAVLAGGYGTTAMVIGAGVGAFAGSVASQAVGSAMGVTSFSWRGALASGAVGAATAGFGVAAHGKAFGPVLANNNVARAAATGVAGGVTSYAASRAAGMEASFSWRSIAAGAVTSALTATVVPALGKKLEVPLGEQWGQVATDTMGGLVGGIGGMHVRRAFGMGGAVDYGQVLMDAFGNMLANAAAGNHQRWAAAAKPKSSNGADRYAYSLASNGAGSVAMGLPPELWSIAQGGGSDVTTLGSVNVTATRDGSGGWDFFAWNSHHNRWVDARSTEFNNHGEHWDPSVRDWSGPPDMKGVADPGVTDFIAQFGADLDAVGRSYLQPLAQQLRMEALSPAQIDHYQRTGRPMPVMRAVTPTKVAASDQAEDMQSGDYVVDSFASAGALLPGLLGIDDAQDMDQFSLNPNRPYPGADSVSGVHSIQRTDQQNRFHVNPPPTYRAVQTIYVDESYGKSLLKAIGSNHFKGDDIEFTDVPLQGSDNYEEDMRWRHQNFASRVDALDAADTLIRIFADARVKSNNYAQIVVYEQYVTGDRKFRAMEFVRFGNEYQPRSLWKQDARYVKSTNPNGY